jgi:glycine betaine/proline transport system substrate-binding protein
MDIFLGNWMPTMENDIKQYRDAGTVETVRANLENAKYTLAVPEALYDKGLKDFADIAKFKEELDGKIYGIEPGNDGNRTIQSMIDKNAFGLKDAGFKWSSPAKPACSRRSNARRSATRPWCSSAGNRTR